MFLLGATSRGGASARGGRRFSQGSVASSSSACGSSRSICPCSATLQVGTLDLARGRSSRGTSSWSPPQMRRGIRGGEQAGAAATTAPSLFRGSSGFRAAGDRFTPSRQSFPAAKIGFVWLRSFCRSFVFNNIVASFVKNRHSFFDPRHPPHAPLQAGQRRVVRRRALLCGSFRG
jgi:hypothetical protein